MTTIILTIIGILLAAAAALMVIFYGGDAFNSGSVGAQANTYQNAGTNVISAVQLAKADNAPEASFTLAGLVGTTPETNYLKETPALNESTDASLVEVGTDTGQYRFTATVGGANSAAVCARINKNLKLATPSATVSSSIKMGCATTGNVFFANA